MIKVGDDKLLSAKLTEKQKLKGTFDSPCMSICDYDGAYEQCQTCFLRKDEKKLWKSSGPKVKADILADLLKRLL